MKCRKCGAEFDKGAFCPECGTKNQLHTVDSKKNTMAIVSLVAGILSVVTLGCWIIPEIIAIVCGISSKSKEESKAATGGIVCGIIATIIFVLIVGVAISVNVFSESNSTNSSTETDSEAIVTTEEVVETTATTEKTNTKEEQTKDKNDLSGYYGKNVSELEKVLGYSLEKDGSTYYSGVFYLGTDENNNIINISMVFNPIIEDDFTFEGISMQDTIEAAASKLEAKGYTLEEDSDSKVYKNNGMVVALTATAEDEYLLDFMNDEAYASLQDEQENDTPEGYYVTDTAWGDTIRTHVYYAYTENSWGSNIVKVECEITNLSDESITFDARDYYQLDNNGITVNVNGTDYDYKEISAGYSFKATLSFTCPENSNTDLSLMTMTADNLEFNLGDKPQNSEEMQEFAGTYNRPGNKIIVLDNGDGTYTVQKIVEIGGETTINEYTNVTLNENNIFYLDRGGYLWSPEEYTIYSYDPTWDEIDKDQTPWVKN